MHWQVLVQVSQVMWQSHRHTPGRPKGGSIGMAGLARLIRKPELVASALTQSFDANFATCFLKLLTRV